MTIRRGIVLAGGANTRLYPLTRAVSKQLLPVYDKPMVYYPLSLLMLSGIREVLIISTPRDTDCFRELFGDGSQLGIRIEYRVQDKPEGIAQALVLGEDFIDGEGVALVLGDNILYGQGLPSVLRRAIAQEAGATVFAIEVQNPQDYGVVAFDADGKAVSLEEKPAQPKSRNAVIGLYLYDEHAPAMAREVKRSPRGEYDITDLNRRYLEQGQLSVVRLGRGTAWFDAGTVSALLDAGDFVRTIQTRQGNRIACLEEIAFVMGYIDRAQLRRLGEALHKTDYGQYLLRLANDE